MSVRHFVFGVVIVLSTVVVSAKELVPFHGTWVGHTISAQPISPTIVRVVSAGGGNASHLGKFTMVTPHLSFMQTLEIQGTQIFTAANGDTLYADTPGFLAPNGDGSLEGTLNCTILGGTGRFEGATGSYSFHLIARPGAFGFDTIADFRGVISSPGSK
ncbi:MAG: hypothetical protein ABI837_12210 [Acidobacteriota bacterium]